MTTRTTPPFRADNVGSYLRSDAVHQARTELKAGRIEAAELAAIEDRDIRDLIAKQEAIGLDAITDGEIRRGFWQFDFFGMLDGVELVEGNTGMTFQGNSPRPLSVRITGKLGFPADHPMLQHFAFLRDNTSRVAKMTIPAPTVMHFRMAADALAGSGYTGRDDFFEDLAATYRDAVAAFYAAGCRYLQFDDTAWGFLCSDVELEKARARGLTIDGIQEAYVKLINDSLRDKPDDMVVTSHVCRGNFRSTWIASGGYEPVAENLFGKVNYDGYFLEYDSERAGGFEPLRFLPKGKKVVVLGLISSKTGELEAPGDVEKRIAEAATIVPLDQLALSAQCGFASTEEGNSLTEDQQWAKMREIVEVAQKVWS
ncbi:MAG TPA: 5-methyltetrahydropteroyltriglutamate--homocysteine S-methyltransferase [Pseudolysinimonas sp.]|nr:5-methyltetrahydropteroyltriglutamate--homocysteine S-methyltransferase [Pseudolysinimonas sp.]